MVKCNRSGHKGTSFHHIQLMAQSVSPLERLQCKEKAQDYSQGGGSTYKVIFGLVNGAGDDLFTLTSLIDSSGTRGHAYKIIPSL